MRNCSQTVQGDIACESCVDKCAPAEGIRLRSYLEVEQSVEVFEYSNFYREDPESEKESEIKTERCHPFFCLMTVHLVSTRLK